MIRRGLAVLVALVLLAGCGDDDSGRTRDDRPARTSPATLPSDQGAAAYVGLSKRAAIARAEDAGVPWRITREDDASFPVTQDYNPDRLNFEIDDGKVTRATYG